MRSPAYAFPTMSLNRTVGDTGGNRALSRAPIQIADGRTRAASNAQSWTTLRIRLCSIRPLNTSNTIALFVTHASDVFRIVLPTMFTTPVEVRGRSRVGRL